jgi:hypothetical protein
LGSAAALSYGDYTNVSSQGRFVGLCTFIFIAARKICQGRRTSAAQLIAQRAILARRKDDFRSLSSPLPLGGFNVDVHARDDRISLCPAAPFRLATLPHAWTIAQVGWSSSLVRQTGRAKICESP